jgi:hypothetical protein
VSTPTDWRVAYARQADADWKAWELYEEFPAAVAAECHKLLFLPMACEKLCKAHLIWKTASPQDVQTSHAYIAKGLPTVVNQYILDMRKDVKGMQGVMTHVRHMAKEIELLNPLLIAMAGAQTTASILGKMLTA